MERLRIIGFTVLFLLPKRKNAVNLSFAKFHCVLILQSAIVFLVQIFHNHHRYKAC